MRLTDLSRGILLLLNLAILIPFLNSSQALADTIASGQLRPIQKNDAGSAEPGAGSQQSDKHRAEIRTPLAKIAPLIKIGSFTSPIRLDASYNQPVTLADCLSYAVSNNLAIKISRESYIYQLYTFFANVSLFLPTNTMTWNLVRDSVGPNPNTALARFRVFSETIRFPVFQGGNVFYNSLSQYYRQKGWHKALDATTADTLLTVYKNYNNLLLNVALLQICAETVNVSQAHLEFNEKQLKAGKGTRYAVMQATGQLEADRQSLLEQQVLLRTAAINLSYSLNGPMSVNLIPAEDGIRQARLVDERASVDDLLSHAFAHRSELRQYEQFTLAAKRTVSVAASPLAPSASFFRGYTHSSTSVSGSEDVAGAGVFGGLFNTNQVGFVASQTLSGVGVPAVMNIYAARALARQALHQGNQELISIDRGVRLNYLKALTSRQKIRTAALRLSAAQEALRMARVRLKAGASNSMEFIEAQKDYVSAQINQAKAISSSNEAQAQLLHDIGLISVDTLTATEPVLLPRTQ